MIEKTIEKYKVLAKKYGMDLRITCIHSDIGRPVTSYDETIILNLDQIHESEIDQYLAAGLRRILIPKMVIHTDRLVLRHPCMEDSDDIFEIVSDRETCLSDGGYEPFLKKDEMFTQAIGMLVNETGRFAVCLDGKVIGLINLMEDHRAVESFEIGYCFNRMYRKRGYASEAVGTIVDILLDELQLDMVCAGITEKNLASMKVLEKTGFVFEGRRIKMLKHVEDGIVDLLYYTKCKPLS